MPIEASTQLDLYDVSRREPGPRRHRYGRYRLFAAAGVWRPMRAGVIEHLEEGGAPDYERIQRRLRCINEGCAAMNDNIYRQAASGPRKVKV